MRILYIDIDTLRADHLGCAGYHRNTTPNIDALAAEGVRFSNVYASDVPCLPSRTALITGMFGIRNGVANHGGMTAERIAASSPQSRLALGRRASTGPDTTPRQYPAFPSGTRPRGGTAVSWSR